METPERVTSVQNYQKKKQQQHDDTSDIVLVSLLSILN